MKQERISSKFTNSQTNLSEAREHFFKNKKAHHTRKYISEALEQVLAHKRFK